MAPSVTSKFKPVISFKQALLFSFSISEVLNCPVLTSTHCSTRYCSADLSNFVTSSLVLSLWTGVSLVEIESRFELVKDNLKSMS